jgi:hypothetical protein
MTTSTCSTVSAEEVKRFAEEMAARLGMTHLLGMEMWAHPNLRPLAVPEELGKLRNGQLHLRIEKPHE